MADDIQLNLGSGGSILSTRQIDGSHHQRIKIEHGFGTEATEVSDRNPLPVSLFPGNNPVIDAFDRIRVSQPTTLFDSKQIWDAQPLVWDDQEVSGSATTSNHSVTTVSTTIGVSLNTAGKRVRQTFQCFNYFPGKSQLAVLTGVLNSSGGGSGITQRIGIFDDNNGMFFEIDDGVVSVVIRSKTSGSVVDTKVNQNGWQLDQMDGTGSSGIDIDFTKTQIFVIDFEWLGVGSVRFGFVVDGILHYCHRANHTNTTLIVPYTANPNLPIRYSIENDGTGVASELIHICSTVISEGGEAESSGALRYISTAGTAVVAASAGTTYALIGLRLKSTHLSCVTRLLDMTIFNEGAQDYEWQIALNATVAGGPTWNNLSNSCMQYFQGAAANTVTGGTAMAGGVVKGGNNAGASADILRTTAHIGAAIDGTPDELVLCATPYAANADFHGSMEWREFD